jgi:hypothetical protein
LNFFIFVKSSWDAKIYIQYESIRDSRFELTPDDDDDDDDPEEQEENSQEEFPNS